jgi:hypothetical protein
LRCRQSPGVDASIKRAIAYAPHADLIWMETAVPSLAEAKQFAAAVKAEYPDQMLAYNLSPSFNWDAAGMTEEEMETYVHDLGQAGFCWQFITLAGFHVNALSIDNFAKDFSKRGMRAYVEGVQRQEREKGVETLTHQQWSGAGYLDAQLATLDPTSTTLAMGSGVTEGQFGGAAAATGGNLLAEEVVATFEALEAVEAELETAALREVEPADVRVELPVESGEKVVETFAALETELEALEALESDDMREEPPVESGAGGRSWLLPSDYLFEVPKKTEGVTEGQFKATTDKQPTEKVVETFEKPETAETAVLAEVEPADARMELPVESGEEVVATFERLVTVETVVLTEVEPEEEREELPVAAGGREWLLPSTYQPEVPKKTEA